LTELDVKPKYFDKTGDTSYSSKETAFSKPDVKPITTPVVGIDVGEIRYGDHLAPVAIGLNEIYHVFEEPDKENTRKMPLSKLVDDARKQQMLYNGIQDQLNKLSGPTIFFTEYRGKTYPKDIERNFILHIGHTFSDMPCLPITPNIAKAINIEKRSFDDYLDFINESIEWLSTYRKKPIMGIITDFGYARLSRLIKLYVDEGINAFCVDFNGRKPISHKAVLAQCYRILGDRAENSFFYAINVNQGRFIHNKTAIDAKDVLSFGFGIDAMSRPHRPPPFPSKEMREKLGPRWKPLNREENKVRLFIKAEYGYYKIHNTNEIRNYPIDASIPLRVFANNLDVTSPYVKHCEKMFNMEQLAIEASVLRTIIREDSPMSYLETKKHSNPQDRKQIKKFKEEITRTTLDIVL
jgi:hypothetical protein